jgi:hypothetical protein
MRSLWAPTGEGDAIMASARELLAACPEWMTTQVGRPTLRWRASEIDFPSIGDESFAFRSIAPMILEGEATGDHVTMRIGDVFNLVGYASIGAHDSGGLERYALLAAEKLRAAIALADS